MHGKDVRSWWQSICKRVELAYAVSESETFRNFRQFEPYSGSSDSRQEMPANFS